MKVLYDIDFGPLEKALKDLRQELKGGEGNIVAKSLMKAAYPIWREAQAKAPVSKKEIANTKAVGQAVNVSFGSDRVRVVGFRKPAHMPGNLQRSIKRKRHPRPRYLAEIVGIGVEQGGTRANPTGAYYGHFVEFGTVKQKRQSFLRPAIESNRANAIRIFGSEAGRLIEQAGAKIGRKYQGISNTSANRIRYKGRL